MVVTSTDSRGAFTRPDVVISAIGATGLVVSLIGRLITFGGLGGDVVLVLSSLCILPSLVWFGDRVASRCSNGRTAPPRPKLFIGAQVLAVIASLGFATLGYLGVGAGLLCGVVSTVLLGQGVTRARLGNGTTEAALWSMILIFALSLLVFNVDERPWILGLSVPGAIASSAVLVRLRRRYI